MARLLDAGNFVRTLTSRQGLQSGSPEEIAFENGWITKEDLLARCRAFGEKRLWGQYLKQVAK